MSNSDTKTVKHNRVICLKETVKILKDKSFINKEKRAGFIYLYFTVYQSAYLDICLGERQLNVNMATLCCDQL